jgi:catalase
MDNRKTHLMLAVPAALLGAMLSCTVFGDNLRRDNDSPETLCDPRGFAPKFYTSEGNWDLVGNDLPLFFIRDASTVPDIERSLKASPTDNLQSSERFFDLFSHAPEATNTHTHLYSDFGTPASHQKIDGDSVDAFKFVNTGDEIAHVKFNWRTPHTGSQVTQCEWHSSDSSKTLVGLRFSVRVPTLISGTPDQVLVASSGSNSQELSCSG